MADTQGAIVTRRAAEADSTYCRRWRLWTGTLWDEAVEGTNGVGTCLAEERTITVHRDQHFRTRHTSLTCTVSPVFDAAGRLAAALDISSFRPDPTGAVVPLVQAVTREAARRIEAHCFHERYAGSLIISLPEAGEGASMPLLALDDNRRVVGATRAARDVLAIDEAAISAGVAVRDMAMDAVRPGAMVEATHSVLAGALATMQGNVSAAAHSLGISRATLHRKIKCFGLQVRRPR